MSNTEGKRGLKNVGAPESECRFNNHAVSRSFVIESTHYEIHCDKVIGVVTK